MLEQHLLLLQFLLEVYFFKRQWMLSRKFGYITPGEMYYDYYKSDTIRVISVLVTFFVAIPI